jgi:hypothetical protein
MQVPSEARSSRGPRAAAAGSPCGYRLRAAPSRHGRRTMAARSFAESAWSHTFAARSPHGCRAVAPRLGPRTAARSSHNRCTIHEQSPQGQHAVAAWSPRGRRAVNARLTGGRRTVAAWSPNGRRVVATQSPHGRRAVAARSPHGRHTVATKSPRGRRAIAALVAACPRLLYQPP